MTQIGPLWNDPKLLLTLNLVFLNKFQTFFRSKNLWNDIFFSKSNRWQASIDLFGICLCKALLMLLNAFCYTPVAAEKSIQVYKDHWKAASFVYISLIERERERPTKKLCATIADDVFGWSQKSDCRELFAWTMEWLHWSRCRKVSLVHCKWLLVTRAYRAYATRCKGTPGALRRQKRHLDIKEKSPTYIYRLFNNIDNVKQADCVKWLARPLRARFEVRRLFTLAFSLKANRTRPQIDKGAHRNGGAYKSSANALVCLGYRRACLQFCWKEKSFWMETIR